MPAKRRPPARKRGWPVGLAAVLMALLGGSLVAAVFNSRAVRGSIPGQAAILGLAVLPSGYLIGTADGALSSLDGREWSRLPQFAGTTLVVNGGVGALLINGGRTLETADIATFTDVGNAPEGVVSLGANGAGELYFVTGPGGFFRASRGQSPVGIQAQNGPGDVISLVVGQTSPTLLAGGLSSGLWLSEDGGVSWTRLLGTPTRSVLLDKRQAGTTFIATAGGVLTSADGRRWSFTDLREPVEALAQGAESYFAIAASRLLYESSDGLTWKAKSPAE